ncbi:MAG: hypothetical protein Q4C56_09065 [Peptococcaceae bacterium]|nr:hypothetical protein [Peptococcaceae bacterium]
MLYFNNPPALTADEQKKLQRAVDRYVEQVLKAGGSPFERVRCVHRLVQQNVIFPRLSLSKAGAINVAVLPKTEEGRHYVTAYGALVNERANSYGIARAVDTILCDPRLNIASQLVEGCVIDDELNATMHLWNIVSIRGGSYHVDTAMDILCNPQAMRRTGEPGKPLSTLDNHDLPIIEILVPAYNYCLVSDDIMQGDHFWSLNETPRCLSNYIPASKI